MFISYRIINHITRGHGMPIKCGCISIDILYAPVQILHSAEEHNLSPFDLNIACLCQSIEINNNKYVYRQSQVRKSTDSGVKWAECSLITGTGCRVQVF